MKLVRENINFERGKDPKAAMGLGNREVIKKYFNDFPFVLLENNHYTINDDLSIDVRDDFPLGLQGEKELFPNGELPPYINFGTTGELDVDDCGIKSLRGFPKKVDGYFSCQGNKLESLEEGPKEVSGSYYCNGNPGNFISEDVKEVCEVGESIQADDMENW